MRTIPVTIAGTRYVANADFDLFMAVEERVPIHILANGLRAANTGRGASIPMTTIAWVIWSVARRAKDSAGNGPNFNGPEDALQALINGNASEYGETLSGLIVSYYGVGPEKQEMDAPKKKEPSKRTKAGKSPPETE